MIGAKSNKNVVEAVVIGFKKLKPTQKNYVLGVMQGFLLAREPPNKDSQPKDTKVS